MAVGGYYWLGWAGVLAALVAVVCYVMLVPPARHRNFPDYMEQARDHSNGFFDRTYDEHHLDNAPQKIRRNDPCPCGSGLKFKRCHGRLAK